MEKQNRKNEHASPCFDSTADPAEVSTESSEALAYATTLERVCNRLRGLITQVGMEQKKHKKEAFKTGERVDDSYEILLAYLTVALGHCGAMCDGAWEKVEGEISPSSEGLERLGNAVILQAVYDYEAALSRGSKFDHDTMKDIERFADSKDAEFFSGVNFAETLSRIKHIYPQFQKMVREYGAYIIADTMWIRRHTSNGAMVFKNAKYKCPLCGGGLYAYEKKVGGVQRIRCSGCNLEGWYRVKEDN